MCWDVMYSITFSHLMLSTVKFTTVLLIHYIPRILAKSHTVQLEIYHGVLNNELFKST